MTSLGGKGERPAKSVGTPVKAETLPVADLDKARRPLNRNSRLLYQTIRRLIFGACRLYFRIEVHGRENIPATGAFILAPNHRSNLDFAITSTVTTRHMRYMAKDSLWKVSAVISRFFTALGGFPIDRSRPDREALQVAESIVAAGEPLVMFPEGERKSGPLLEPLFDGPVYIASRLGVPIVPVGMGGSERAMPKGSWIIRPRKIVLVIGEPIDPPQRTERGRVPRQARRATTERLAEVLQELFDEAQVRAG